MPIVDLSVFFVVAPQPWGGGTLEEGGTSIYTLYALGMCGSEGYGFQAVK